MSAAPRVYTIPIHRPFADALAAGLLARAGGDRMALARTTLLLPNARAIRTVTDAFVRRAGGGLLLPRMASIGDPELDDRVGPLLEPVGADIPPAIDPVARQLILARLIVDADPAVEAAEAVRLAADLARTIDQMVVEEVAPHALADAVPEALAEHWQGAFARLRLVLDRWPAELALRGRIDLSERRNRLLVATEAAWAASPPQAPLVAAGITVAAPAVARLLRRIARLPQGMVVLPGLDRAMPDAEWEALAPAGEGMRPIETHPQHALRLLLDRMGVARGEVLPWRFGGGGGASAARGRAIHNAMAPAAFTDKWEGLPPRARRLSGVRALELANPAAEAQAIAIALRQAIETPGCTAALVTPDRALATRVAAHLARWGIAADDSAGRPLAQTPAGTLLLAIAEAGVERFAPVALLALLKHPLVAGGGARIDWLGRMRTLDAALRGPRAAPGLDELSRLLGTHRRAAAVWEDVRPLLEPLAAAFAEARAPLAALLAAVREAAGRLAGDAAWAKPAGRAAAALLESLEAAAPDGPALVTVAGFPTLLRTMLEQVAVRPPQGGHPRVAILGLIEARLAQADLVVLGGLNEGVWPSLPAPDPWLAPAIRAALALPGLERRIGVEAQQFAAALGAREVLLTRARRDARAPAVASRFWLRLQAMTGGITPARMLARWAELLDHPGELAPAERPRPAPPAADRPRRIAVTKLDRLKADPFAFYADAMLRLRRWDGVDADPSAAWRGSAVHRVFEAWIGEDGCDPTRLLPRAEALLREGAVHPVLRALWAPRLIEAIEWVGAQVTTDRAAGRTPIAAERKGALTLGEVELYGTVDRVDRLPGGGIAIVDWKTGKPPTKRAVAGGYSMQLGLLGLIAEHGGFGDDVAGRPEAFEYWSMGAGKDRTLGYRESPVGLNTRGEGIDPAEFTTLAARVLAGAVAEYLTGDAPFVAKLHPEYSPYGDYDQLMRLDEWYGRLARAEPQP
ncbi:double-strand break repair protein AddB [Sphingomonas nostoxanthinifaciens]|uniref:double-strand break repair protein AddB n=1 Tax=Sphingomonas nostoxanthinifaciens TaxID=2872652 RepID=UPI001CC1FA58|nr:double-strand break repair protein AddB [Sphingomonas nostoxanthinifaciens]UAK25135.1 double-strand break repair protein AddB [Sphingomonas nostoxanthinifaciens]